MSWLRREPLHERLAREGGLAPEGRPPRSASWDHARGEAGIHGVHRPREWDAVATVEAPGLQGDRAAFVALPDGSLLVEDEAGDEALAPLAEAVEAGIRPPYRAEAVRRDGALWAVGARAIEVVELPELAGDEIELTVRDGERTLLVDGARSFGSVPTLEGLGEARSEAYAVYAERLDGDLWEYRVAPL